MASNWRTRGLALLTSALLMGVVGPFIVADARNELRASTDKIENSSLGNQQQDIGIDAFDMEICGKANLRPWQEKQSAFGCTGQSHELGEEDVGERAQVAPRIIGGEFAQEGEFPSYVHINLTQKESGLSKRMFICGATLIHPNLVVTAAHCLDGLDPPVNASAPRVENMTLVFGSNLFNGTGGQVREVDRWCHLGNYKTLFDLNLSFFPINDLAVIRFKGNVKYTSKISPACLNLNSRPSNETICAFAGLGFISNDGRSSPDQLKTLSVKRSCQEEFVDQSCYLTTNSGLQTGHRGDSGSPVICYDQCNPDSSSESKSFAVGAISWKRGMSDPNPEPTLKFLAENVADFHQLKPGFLDLLQAIRLEGEESFGNTKCKVPYWLEPL